jgi:tryptophan synthase alpha chain
VAEFADAAVIGSAIVDLIERSTPEAAPAAVSRFIKGLRMPQAALAQ